MHLSRGPARGRRRDHSLGVGVGVGVGGRASRRARGLVGACERACQSGGPQPFDHSKEGALENTSENGRHVQEHELNVQLRELQLARRAGPGNFGAGLMGLELEPNWSIWKVLLVDRFVWYTRLFGEDPLSMYQQTLNILQDLQ